MLRLGSDKAARNQNKDFRNRAARKNTKDFPNKTARKNLCPSLIYGLTCPGDAVVFEGSSFEALRAKPIHNLHISASKAEQTATGTSMFRTLLRKNLGGTSPYWHGPWKIWPTRAQAFDTLRAT